MMNIKKFILGFLIFVVFTFPVFAFLGMAEMMGIMDHHESCVFSSLSVQACPDAVSDTLIIMKHISDLQNLSRGIFTPIIFAVSVLVITMLWMWRLFLFFYSKKFLQHIRYCSTWQYTTQVSIGTKKILRWLLLHNKCDGSVLMLDVRTF